MNVAELAKLLAISEADFDRRYREQLRTLNPGPLPATHDGMSEQRRTSTRPAALAGRGRGARSRPG